jgi:hypothetical protein
MSNYDIFTTDGVTKYTIPDKGFNTDTDLTFIGNNSQKYGEYLQQNFINLLTNFYSLPLDLQPNATTSLHKTKAIPGQLIYDGNSNLFLCTAPSPNGVDNASFEKIALLPCEPSVSFVNSNLKEDPYNDGKLSGYIVIRSNNCHFKKNISTLPVSSYLTITALKNANNTPITGITPVVYYINATNIAVTFTGTVNATDANINSGTITVGINAFKEIYTNTLTTNTYSFADNPIIFYSQTLSSYSYPNIKQSELFSSLQHIQLGAYSILVNLDNNADYAISRYICIKDDKITDINSLYSLSGISGYEYFHGLQSVSGVNEFKHRFVTYSNTMASVFVNSATGLNSIVEFRIVSDKLSASIKSLPTECQSTSNNKIVFLLTETLVVRVDYENQIHVHNIGNGNVSNIGYYHSPDMTDVSQQYNLIDIFYINNTIYYIWGYNGKINITNATTGTKLLSNDVEILKTSKFDSYFYKNPYGTALSASSSYIAFCGTDGTNIIAYKFDGSTLSNYSIGTKASYGTNVFCDDVIIDTDIHYIIKGTKVSDVMVNTSLSSHTITELSATVSRTTYTVLNDSTASGAVFNFAKYFYYNKKYLLNLNNV